MFESSEKEYVVPFDGSFRVSKSPSEPSGNTDTEKELKSKLTKLNGHLYDLQRVLYAHNKYSLLVIFQAMDAAGKDSTIRMVMRGVNPAGCQVTSFKQPSAEELDHDFLWRSNKALPERGRIGIFNRSYYEETLVVRVHPEYLEKQNLPQGVNAEDFWNKRFEAIRNMEKYLAENGTVILKFWLNVSKEEQKNRFLDRLNDPRKQWKFSTHDITERGYWDDYMSCYENALNATSRPWAPWFAIPADNKPYMRVQVAKTIRDTLRKMDMDYPTVDKEVSENMDELIDRLQRT